MQIRERTDDLDNYGRRFVSHDSAETISRPRRLDDANS